MVNYGRLSKERLGSVESGELYYKDKHIRGFWLNTYLQECGNEKAEKIKQDVIDNCELFRQKIRKVLPLESFEQAIKLSVKDQS